MKYMTQEPDLVVSTSHYYTKLTSKTTCVFVKHKKFGCHVCVTVL